MLYTLFIIWAFAVAVPATLLALVVVFQSVATRVRRLTEAAGSTTPGVAVEA